MYKRLIFNDLKKSKSSSLIIFFFIFLASLLSSVVSFTSIRLIDSINNLTLTTKAPHFVQMHQGDLDIKKIEDFARDNPKVESFQILPFLNVNNDDIKINDKDFPINSQDNGFTYQSDNFDYLLDLDNKIIRAKEGEVYIPISYFTNNSMAVGDIINIAGLNLKVKSPIRDIQMSSPLSTSKRFLINEKDLEKLSDIGKMEYLIEFRLKNIEGLKTFESDYANANLYSNGPTITYPLIKLVNGLSYGIIILLISLLAIISLLISFLCIRFSLLFKIEEEKKQIAVLKCIGIQLSKIKKIYLAKYVFIACGACALSFIVSIYLSPSLTKNIELILGKAENEIFSYLIAGIICILIFFTVLIFINSVLNRFKDLSPREAIFENIKESQKSFSLLKPVFKNSSSYLAYIELIKHKALFVGLFFILILVSFILIIPQSLYTTLKSKDFVAYMGLGEVQYMITSQDQVSRDKIKNMENILDNMGISYSTVYFKSYDLKVDEDSSSRILISYGDKTSFNKGKGRMPKSDKEIAISYLIAKELGKDIGDSLSLKIENNFKDFKIVGIYSDITNGAMTGKLILKDQNKPSQRISLYLSNVNDKLRLKKLAQYNNMKAISIDEYRLDILNSTIDKLSLARIISFLLGFLLTFLISLLFTKLMIVKYKKDIAIFKSLGFSLSEIYKKYLKSFSLISFIGLAFGLILAKFIGEKLVSIFMQSLGIGDFKFLESSIITELILIISLFFLVIIAVVISFKELKNISLKDYIKE